MKGSCSCDAPGSGGGYVAGKRAVAVWDLSCDRDFTKAGYCGRPEKKIPARCAPIRKEQPRRVPDLGSTEGEDGSSSTAIEVKESGLGVHGMTELWLVRHGETAWSLSGAHTSFTEIPLTKHGRQRALELKDFFKNKAFTAVLVSPRQRAQETARLAGFGDVMQTVDDLQEWNYGESEGKTTAEMRKVHGPQWSVWTDPILGGEPVEAVGVRADHVIDRALAVVEKTDASDSSPASKERAMGLPAAPRDGKKGDGKDETLRVALFAHAHILRILAARWIGRPAVDGRLFTLGTGSVSVLGFERETRVIVHWNRGFEGE